ncbi:MAG: hypothetical protein M3P50_02870 [Actinomycetota bacterium]|nr:hypothetical protein [Actinomycetota bacterium]
MRRTVLIVVTAGAVTIAVTGAVVAVIWHVSWGDGIGAVCFVGALVWLVVAMVVFIRWLVVAMVVFIRWLVAGRAPLALRAGAATASAGLLFASVWFEVRFAAYDGCTSSTGDQPVLTVPVSLVTQEPAWENDGLVDPLICPSLRGRDYDLVGFADVP